MNVKVRKPHNCFQPVGGPVGPRIQSGPLALRLYH